MTTEETPPPAEPPKPDPSAELAQENAMLKRQLAQAEHTLGMFRNTIMVLSRLLHP